MRPYLLAAAVAAFALAGCGGGGSSPATSNPSNPANPGGTSPTSNSRTVTVQVVVSGKTHTSVREANGRRREFISPSTNGLDVKVYTSGTATLIGEVESDISSGSAACGGKTGTPRTCTVYIPAPVGADDFVATTYDAAPVNSSFAAANELGIGKLTQTIKIDVNNVLSIYIGGLINTLGYLAPNVSEPADGTSHDFMVLLNPQDFDDNAITAGTNDPYANPISISLTQTGGSHSTLVLNGTAVGTTATLSHSSDTLAIRYDGLGAPGYFAKLAASATGAPAESFYLAPLFVTDTNPPYSNGELTLDGGPGSGSTLTIGETNGPATQYTVTPNAGCANVATASTPAPGENSSTKITAGSTTGTGCSFAISDGMSTITVAVDNTSTSTVVTVPGTTEGPISFASYSLGPIQGQMNWLSDSCGGNDYSAHVVSTGTAPYSSAMWPGATPAQALQIDNSVTQGCFSGLASPPTSNSAGYANSLSNSTASPPVQCGATCQPFFSEQFVVTSATGGFQPALQMSISPVWENQGARMSYVGLWHTQDTSSPAQNKLLIYTYDVEGVDTTDGFAAPCFECVNFDGYEVEYVDPTQPHLIGETIQFVPPTSDVVKIYVDGVLAGTKTTYRSWEDYYLYDTESDPGSANPYSRAVDDLLFRPGNVDGCANFADLQNATGCQGPSAGSHTNNANKGFLFDAITTCAGSESSCASSIKTMALPGRHGAVEMGTRKIKIPRSVFLRT